MLLFASYLFGRPMNLEFSLPEIAAVALAVWIVAEISGDGECNWLEGVELLSVYLIICILFFFLSEPAHVQNGKSGTASRSAISHSNPEPSQPKTAPRKWLIHRQSMSPQARTGWRQIRARSSDLNRQMLLPTPGATAGGRSAQQVQCSAELAAQETFPAHQVPANFGQSPGLQATR